MAELVSPCCGAGYSDHCDDYFHDPLEDYEFENQMRERIEEDRMDELRDML